MADDPKRMAVAPPPPPRPREPKAPPAPREPEPPEDVLSRLEAVVAQLTGPGVQIIQTPTPVPPSADSLLPLPPNEPPSEPPESRPSMRVRAAKQTSRIVRWIGVVISVLTLLAQAISMLSRPENGPLVQTLIVLAAGLRGQPAPAPSELPEPVWTPPGE